MDSIIMEEQLLAGGTNGGNGRRHSGATAAHVLCITSVLVLSAKHSGASFLGGGLGEKARRSLSCSRGHHGLKCGKIKRTITNY